MLATVGLANVLRAEGHSHQRHQPRFHHDGTCPGGAQLESKKRGQSEEEVLAQLQAKVPLRRYAAPEDVANLALFLASNKASYITGAVVPMDGGLNPVL